MIALALLPPTLAWYGWPVVQWMMDPPPSKLILIQTVAPIMPQGQSVFYVGDPAYYPTGIPPSLRFEYPPSEFTVTLRDSMPATDEGPVTEK
jgi:hypothetical protein